MEKTASPAKSHDNYVDVAETAGNNSLPLRPQNLVYLTISNGFTIPMTGEVIKDHIEEVLNFKMRSNDVTVASYPKSGTTWVQEIVWLICNDADIERAKAASLFRRFCLLDMPGVSEFDMMRGMTSLDACPQDQRRFIKTHLPFEVQPMEQQSAGRGKIIYVVRNPKDDCVSFYHMHRMYNVLQDPKTWSEFLDKFCNGQVVYGTWFDHVSKWWQVYQERKDSIYIIQYESMKKDLKAAVMQLAKFLEKELSDEQINSIVQHCSFKEMSKNKNTNWSELKDLGFFDFNVSKFMRKGEVGDWKNYFTVNQSEAFDELMKIRLKDCDLKFEYDLSG